MTYLKKIVLLSTMLSFFSHGNIITKEYQKDGKTYKTYNNSIFLCHKKLIDDINYQNFKQYSFDSFDSFKNECIFKDGTNVHSFILGNDFSLFTNTLDTKGKVDFNYVIINDSNSISEEDSIFYVEKSMEELEIILSKDFQKNNIEFNFSGYIKTKESDKDENKINEYISNTEEQYEKIKNTISADFFIIIDDTFGFYGRAYGFGPKISQKEDLGSGIIITNNSINDGIFNKAMAHEMGHVFGLAHDVLTLSNYNSKNSPTGKIIDKSTAYPEYAIMYTGKGFKNPLTKEASIMSYPYPEDNIGQTNEIAYYNNWGNSFSSYTPLNNYDSIVTKWKDFTQFNDHLYEIAGKSISNTIANTGSFSIQETPNQYLNRGVSNVEALNVSLSLWDDENNNNGLHSYFNITTPNNDNVYLFSAKDKDYKYTLKSSSGDDNFYFSSGHFDLDFSNGRKNLYMPITNNNKNDYSFNEHKIKINNFEKQEHSTSSDHDNVFISRELFNDNEMISLKTNVIQGIRYIEGVVLNFENGISKDIEIDVNFDPNFQSNKNLVISFLENDGEWNSALKNNVGDIFYNSLENGYHDDDLVQLEFKYSDSYYGTEESDLLAGDSESNYFYGYEGNDILGSDSNEQWLGNPDGSIGAHGDIFIGGKDNDVIYGTRYGDTYLYDIGDGNDTIYETGSLFFESDTNYAHYIKDRLELKNIKNQDINISRNNYDVIIEIIQHGVSSEHITIKNMLKQTLFEGNYYHNHAIEEIILDDIILYKNNIIQEALIVKGTKGNDTITGLNEYVNTFESSLGIDTYIGSTNNDIYNISSNIGILTIQESYGNDEINFTGLTDLTFIEEDGNVNVYDLNDNLIVKIEGFTLENNLIETIKFNGNSYTSANFDEIISPAKTCEGPELTRSELIAKIDAKEDVTKVCVGTIKDFSKLFYSLRIGEDMPPSLQDYLKTFNQDISGWDVSNGVNFESIFRNAFAFNQNINNWNVSNGVNFKNSFKAAESYNQPLNNWDTSSAENMEGMFIDAIMFNQDISGWDVDKVTDGDFFKSSSALSDENTPPKFL